MSVAVQYHDERAVVCHDGPLTWAACHEFVGVIETAVEAYFYTEVEPIVSSPGGETGALVHVLGALSRWRRNGVRFRTRVISNAASAASILVCTGDERIADRGAGLLFHDAQALNAGPLGARDTAELHSALRTIDEGLHRVLVERTLSNANNAELSRYGAEESDRRVLEHLYSRLDASLGRRKLRGIRALARALGRAVDKAVRANDASTLSEIYRQLARCDRAISATLALTLGLVDRIGPVELQERRSLGDWGLVIPEWRALYRPEGEVPRELLTRHTLVLGETGSGKTASAILPVAAAAARAPSGRVGAALVIDPKCELGTSLKQLVPSRFHHLRAASVALNVMSGPRWRLGAHLAEGRWFTAALLIVLRVSSMVPGNPARVLARHSVGGSNEEFFAREGAELAVCVLGFILMVTSPRGDHRSCPIGHEIKHEAQGQLAHRLIHYGRRRIASSARESSQTEEEMPTWCHHTPDDAPLR